jgi:hypothetical protein
MCHGENVTESCVKGNPYQRFRVKEEIAVE